MKTEKIKHPSYCGLNCYECKIYLATINEDFEEKRIIAQKWSNNFGQNYIAEDVGCMGCKVTNEKQCPFCTLICELRACAQQKNVETCAHCSEYPCDLFDSGKYDFAKVLLDKINS